MPKFVHQSGLGVQTTCGVDDDDVDTGIDARRDGIEGHRSGVGGLLAADGVRTDPFAPRLQLIGCGRTEGVGGAWQHAPTVSDEHAS